jgi:hypothetical protein
VDIICQTGKDQKRATGKAYREAFGGQEESFGEVIFRLIEYNYGS